MAPKNIFSAAVAQTKVFYSGEWTRPIDGVFVQELVDQAAAGNFKVGHPNHHAILSAQGLVNAQFGKSFDFNYCKGKLHKLRKCYEVFTWITQQSGVVFTYGSNKVEASESTWEYLIRKEKLAMAYMKEGESALKEMHYLFGNGDINAHVQPKQVIELSDDEVEGDNDDEDKDGNPYLATENDSDNTNNCFHYELAWYNTDSTSVSSVANPEKPPTNLASTSVVMKKFENHWASHDWDKNNDNIYDILNSFIASSSSP